LKNQYKWSKTKLAHINISHGALVKSFAKFCAGAPRRVEDPVEKVSYCGIAGIKIEKNNFQLIMGGRSSHLADMNDAAVIKASQENGPNGALTEEEMK